MAQIPHLLSPFQATTTHLVFLHHRVTKVTPQVLQIREQQQCRLDQTKNPAVQLEIAG